MRVVLCAGGMDGVLDVEVEINRSVRLVNLDLVPVGKVIY